MEGLRYPPKRPEGRTGVAPPRFLMPKSLPISVQGARTHNLDDVSLELPRYKLIAFCGVSGSGKTSMAIDTLYAEGQRRYIESFSPYTRQFLQQLDKPEVDQIDGIPPTIAITQQAPSRSNRTTVATATEVADYLRLLFARAGEVTCVNCGSPLVRHSPESIAAELVALPEGRRLVVAFESATPPAEEIEAWRGELVEQGFVRGIAGGRMFSLEGVTAEDLAGESGVLVVVDRLTASPEGTARAQESVETALGYGEGQVIVLEEAGEDTTAGSVEIDGRRWQRHAYRQNLYCDRCQLAAIPPEPRLLDFNSPLGACPECEGFGSISEIDMRLVVPDESKTLAEGAVAPWNSPAYEHERHELLALAGDYDLRTNVPYRELDERERKIVYDGVRERNFGGLKGFFRWLEKRKYKMHLRVFMSRWRSYRDCPSCGGARLRPEALAICLAGKHLADVYRMQVGEALKWFEQLGLGEARGVIAKEVLADVVPRLSYLDRVGVGYLTLDRPLRTLSTGESRRVAMTSTLGSTLVDMLYVLDEPTEGLHANDAARLLEAIGELRDRGNTVIVVEHEETLITGSDHLVEFGPQAGSEGGRIVYEGSPEKVVDAQGSPTGDWLAGRTILGNSERRRPATSGKLTVVGARGNNLQNLSVEIPLGVFAAVAGVSGAGKSTLVRQTLYPALWNRLNPGSDKPLQPMELDDVLGAGQLEDVVLIDQTPVAKSPRSNPATYVKAFDAIRAVFAEQPDASLRGLTASHFSFNVEGGRCERCGGVGQVEVDMQFLADVYMTCTDCQGQRYKPEVLAVRYRGRTIADVFDMTAYDAFRFFRGHPKLQGALKPLLDVGLHYLRLGQGANTLSNGEAQRLKLASYLGAKRRGRTLFLLDEPSSGLHYRDMVQLVDCFDALIEVGHSVLVIEHSVPLLQAADYLIDLGPGAADQGGRVVAQGTPEEVARSKSSVTGRVLREAWRRRGVGGGE